MNDSFIDFEKLNYSIQASPCGFCYTKDAPKHDMIECQLIDIKKITYGLEQIQTKFFEEQQKILPFERYEYLFSKCDIVPILYSSCASQKFNGNVKDMLYSS